ncbi:hypothetical protein OHA25_17600 [Nonomuraea sp. NBC_00507]|uniref:hypothetical protein n=1 Tax=Nonomuraea sp. NBC_00507 TaxID=2976002 RepID=UPI002E18DE9B
MNTDLAVESVASKPTISMCPVPLPGRPEMPRPAWAQVEYLPGPTSQCTFAGGSR